MMPRTVSLWPDRYAREGLAGLQERRRTGPKRKYTEETGRRILAVLERPPPAGFARWTGPLIATELGDVHVQQVWRFLRRMRIDLAGRKSWCQSPDPEFAANAAEIVGLYLDPPEDAIVLAVDEKPHIEALERAQGYLRLANERAPATAIPTSATAPRRCSPPWRWPPARSGPLTTSAGGVSSSSTS
jgi:transposase